MHRGMIKDIMRSMDNTLPTLLDKNSSMYNQTLIDNLYKQLIQVKATTVEILSVSGITPAKKIDYEILLKDLNEHIALLEPSVSDYLLCGPLI